MLDFIKCFQAFNKMNVKWLEGCPVSKTLAIAQAQRISRIWIPSTHMEYLMGVGSPSVVSGDRDWGSGETNYLSWKNHGSRFCERSASINKVT